MVGSLIQTIIGLSIVLGVALAIGYRPTASSLAWVAAAGVLLLFALALVCLSAALGPAAKSVETGSNTPMFLTLLPLVSSGFVPTKTMPGGLRQFAEYQPYTPVTQTVRGLLTGTHTGSHVIAAIAWSLGIANLSYLWAARVSSAHLARLEHSRRRWAAFKPSMPRWVKPRPPRRAANHVHIQRGPPRPR